MIHAYSELYFPDAQRLLASAFDYALTDCGMAPDLFSFIFSGSVACRAYETGNPGVLSGKSGVEFAMEILSAASPGMSLPEPGFRPERTPAYWAGFSLAYYQWVSAKRFRDIFERVPLTEVLEMYSLFHEMDVRQFVDSKESRVNSRQGEPKLKCMREARGFSQSELAKVAGVTLRSVQLYEQRVNDIDKAQAGTVYKLAAALGCSVEDLLEKPITS